MDQATLDQSGKIATADFYAWYGLEDLEYLDKEYNSVRKLLGSDTIELAEEANVCSDGKTKMGELRWNQQMFKCKDTYYGANGYVEEFYDD
jgi:hypothetical protein